MAADDVQGQAQGPEKLSRSEPPEQKVLQEALRDRAEALLEEHPPVPVGVLSEREAARLIHELQVHQVELEIQNEELRQAQLELAASVERYTDLYDFAPIGYLSVGLDGRITRANLAASSMLRTERRHLTGKPFNRYIAAEDIELYLAARQRLMQGGLRETLELRLRPTGGELLWVRLDIVTRLDPSEGGLLWQVAVSNVEAQKKAELWLQRTNEDLEAQVTRRTEELTLANQKLVEEIDRRRVAEAELREREELLERRVAERTSELAALLSVARDMTSTLAIEGVLGIIVRELHRIVEYSGCGIFLLNGELLTLAAYNGPLDDEGLVESQTTLEDSPLLRAVIEARAPVIVPDMLADTPLSQGWQDRAAALHRYLLNKSRAWMGIPMIAQGQPVGVLRLDHLEPGHFTRQEADLVFALASQAAVAVVNARLYAQASHMAAVEERQRLARELHDSVAQTFYSIALATHAAKSRLPDDPATVERRLNHILGLSDAGLAEMKALIFDLQGQGISRDGLVSALQRHVSALTARNDLIIDADLGAEPHASLAAKEAIYGIAREALQNVVRHAAASELTLQLSRTADRLCLEVRDDGRGFRPELVGERTLGLRSMRERAAAAGGEIEISSAPGQGARVRAQVPIGTP